MKGYQTACRRLGVVALVGVLLAGCSENDRPLESPVRFEGGIFGTYYQITLVDPLTQGEANALEEGILAEMEDVDQAMSTYRDDSELVAFNDAPLNEWQPLSNELIEVLAISRSVSEASKGAFDITIGDVKRAHGHDWVRCSRGGYPADAGASPPGCICRSLWRRQRPRYRSRGGVSGSGGHR